MGHGRTSPRHHSQFRSFKDRGCSTTYTYTLYTSCFSHSPHMNFGTLTFLRPTIISSHNFNSNNSAVCIVNISHYGTNNPEIVFRLPARDRNCTLLQKAQVSSGVHRTSYSVATGFLSPRRNPHGLKRNTVSHSYNESQQDALLLRFI